MTQADQQKQLGEALDIYQAGLAMEGDKDAFTLLYRRWHPKLLKLAIRLTRHTDDARDVMQDTALVIARDIHKLRDRAVRDRKAAASNLRLLLTTTPKRR